MTVLMLRDLLRKRPFVPFRLTMSSGEKHEVRHPEMAFLTQTRFVLGIDIAADGVPDNVEICSLSHVTAIEPLNAEASEDA